MDASRTKKDSRPGTETHEPSRFKQFTTKYFNVREWSDWDRSQGSANYILAVIRKFFIPTQRKMGSSQSFDDAVAALKLSEADLQSKATYLKRWAILMVCIALGFYLYAMYQLIYGGILAVALSIVLMLVNLSIAFRYHFWYFQIKQRKLGCTIREWFKESFMSSQR